MHKSELTSWEAVCQFKKLDPNALPDVSMIPERHQKFIQSSYKLAIVAEALNEERDPKWFADYHKENVKFEPWFWIEGTEEHPRGSGFSGSAYVGWNSSSDCGSRLAVATRDMVAFMQKHFEEDFKNVWIIPG